MTQPNRRHLLMLMDRSGSIDEVLDDMQGGFDHFVREQAAIADVKTTGTLWQFDTVVEELFSFVPLAELREYKIVPRGGTALYDAVGRAVVGEGEKLAAMDEDERPSDVIVLIATDGKNNSSREWSRDRLFHLLDRQQADYGWKVVYSGANADTFAESGAIGVAAAMTLHNDGTGRGTRDSWSATSDMLLRASASGVYGYSDEERASADGSGS